MGTGSRQRSLLDIFSSKGHQKNHVSASNEYINVQMLAWYQKALGSASGHLPSKELWVADIGKNLESPY